MATVYEVRFYVEVPSDIPASDDIESLNVSDVNVS